MRGWGLGPTRAYPLAQTDPHPAADSNSEQPAALVEAGTIALSLAQPLARQSHCPSRQRHCPSRGRLEPESGRSDSGSDSHAEAEPVRFLLEGPSCRPECVLDHALRVPSDSEASPSSKPACGQSLWSTR